MTDDVDRAAAREEELRTDALDEQRRRDPSHGKSWTDSAWLCRLCEEPIPEARRHAVPGVQTCVHCQRDLEQGLHTAKGDPR